MKTLLTSVSFGCAILASSVAAHATTLRVENWGSDANPCISTSAPCRSISRAITVAAAGDRIIVGPGVYSDDLDRDAVFNEAGEEPMGGIVVDRDVTIQSSDGASATLIRWTQGTPGSAVVIAGAGANLATFGRKNQGFSLTVLENNVGIYVDVVATNVEVAGNTVKILPTTAFNLFAVAIYASGNGTYVHDNRVLGDVNSSYSDAACIGFWSNGPSQRFDRNTALDCDIGFESGGAMTRNVAVGNMVSGFYVPTGLSEFTRNAALGNQRGVDVDGAPTIFGTNTFAGTTAATNCGLRNNTGVGLTAINNFWGSSVGPGADPADNVCNTGMSSTTTSPAATSDYTQLQAPQR